MNHPFIYPENQKRLWDTIHKIPQINSSFSSPMEKENWFKTTIQLLHEHYPTTPIKELNRTAVDYMIKDIHLRRQPLLEEDEYIKRQREYEQMTKPTQPPEVSFEKIEDTVITNMDELMKQYTNKRSDEIPTPPSNMIIQDILKRLEKLEEKVLMDTKIESP
jgi:hypothetical protein